MTYCDEDQIHLSQPLAGGKLFPAILDFLKHENPDILVVQEAYNAKNDKLGDRLNSIDIIREKMRYSDVDISDHLPLVVTFEIWQPVID